jgi:ribonuclease HI
MERITSCEACGAAEESIFHALFQCTWAKVFWQDLRETMNLKLPSFHPEFWAMDMIDNPKIKEEDTALLLCGCWAIWKERNARKHGEGGRTVTDSVRWVMQTTVDLSRVGKDKPKKPLKPKARWHPPQMDVLKMNTDACFVEDTMSGSTGLVVRNHQGMLMRAQALWYEHSANASLMEAMAIRDGARLAVEMGYQQIIIESDCSEVVQLLNADCLNRSELKPICQEILEITRTFSSFSISLISRDANQAAHLCAKQARSDRRRCPVDKL